MTVTARFTFLLVVCFRKSFKCKVIKHNKITGMTVLFFIIHRRYAFLLHYPSELILGLDMPVQKKNSILRMIGDLLIFYFFGKGAFSQHLQKRPFYVVVMKPLEFSEADKNNYNVWRKSTSQHFDLSAVISSLLKTSRSAKCSSATHYSYFYPLRKSPCIILCHHTYSCNYSCNRL